MASVRPLTALRDLESGGGAAGDVDTPVAKKSLKADPTMGRSRLTRSETVVATGVFLVFVAGIFCIYQAAPQTAKYGRILRLPRSLSDVRSLKDNLAEYAKDYQLNFILAYCSIYIFMQTFMIPGTIFMSLLAGALFGVFRGIILVVLTATAGASSCYFLSKLIGRPLVIWLWPEKLKYFQGEIAKRRDKLLNYINLAILTDIMQAGLALGDLKSVRELYDFKTLLFLFLIGSVAIFPAIMNRKRTYE
ncbi:hypothetical protein LUZ63_005845 [Rhynchospora breviuscula]|uniref:SNARE associated Golgi protein n=1 Tax=Rhynchospora breviuscula TaxID=2022672 RepID=A0A9Q0HTK1_9POAL|nr:hypothetical protein LUZ63_005845 [Rhynchospora breviuscula]